MATFSIPNSSVVRDGFLCMTIIGSTGSGKTRFIKALIPSLDDRIRTILIATQVRGNPDHLDIKKSFRQQSDDRYCGITGDAGELEAAMDQMSTGHDPLVSPRRPGLLIMDDFYIAHQSGTRHEEDFAVRVVARYRNYGWNFISIAQDPTMIPVSIRNNANTRVLFACTSKSALANFNKDVLDRVPSEVVYHRLIDYIRSVPYTYVMVRERPFDVSAGSLDKPRRVMTENAVDVPTLDELMAELGVKSEKDLARRAASLQRGVGNNSYAIDAPQTGSKHNA